MSRPHQDGQRLDLTRALLESMRLAWLASPSQLVATIALGILSGIASVPAAWTTRLLVNNLSQDPAQHLRAVEAEAFIAALLLSLAAVVSYASGLCGSWLGAKVQLTTQATLAEACAAPIGTDFLDSAAQQDALRLAQRGAHEAPKEVISALIQVVSGVATITGYAAVLVSTWPLMLLALVVTALPVAVIQKRIVGRSIRVNIENVVDYRWSEYYEELLRNPSSARDMRVCQAEKLIATRVRLHLKRALSAEAAQQARVAKAQIAFSLINGAVAASGAVIVAGGVATGRLTVGDFVLFSTAVVAVQIELSSLLGVRALLAPTLATFATYVRIMRTLGAQEQARTGAAQTHELVTSIEFRDVWFKYPGASNYALSGLNLRFEAGRSHAIVGLNGAGKTTIVRLLLRFYEPQKGSIVWDGVDIRNLEVESLRSRISCVLQDHLAYELSLCENVTIGDTAHLGSSDRARVALQDAGGEHLLDLLPEGLDTMLSPRRISQAGRRGVGLSGGQWQRVALARSLMRSSPDLLILDEPSAGLDAEAENELHKRLMAQSSSVTTLHISHRLGGLRGANSIIVIDSGRVIERGGHEELMMARGAYAHLFALQASAYAGEQVR